jgi:hypothetical protein
MHGECIFEIMKREQVAIMLGATMTVRIDCSDSSIASKPEAVLICCPLDNALIGRVLGINRND